jgi:putative tryptophan/tyrosine transport system substrate-binding protein
MRRREFIGSLGGAAVFSVWRPAVIKAQQPGRPRRIAILMGVREGDPEGAGRYAALVAGLKERGWIDGDTAKLETWWAGGSIARIREIVPELVGSAPDIIVGNGTAVTGELHEATRTIPVVFNLTVDPVGLGYIERMSRPGGNLTGFIFFEPPLIGKWFDLSRQVSPGVAQTTLLFNPGTGPDTFAAFHQTADYVDRVLRGEKPSDLPAQAPTKYQLVLNLQTARKFNLMFPQTLLAVADEVVE